MAERRPEEEVLERASGAADFRLDQIEVGDAASFRHRISAADLAGFALLSGDCNPLHADPVYAATTRFGRPVVHGMFLASLLSRLVGMHLPGKRCLYLSQSLDFVGPAFVDDEVEVRGSVLQKQEATRTVVLRTEIYAVPDRLIVRGKAHLAVLE